MENINQIKTSCFLFYIEEYNKLKHDSRYSSKQINCSRKLYEHRRSLGDNLIVDDSTDDLVAIPTSLNIFMIKRRFSQKIWLSLGSYIRDLVKLNDKNPTISSELKKFWDEDIYPLADSHFYHYFYRELSLQEKVKPGPFPFDISNYRINASFII